MNAAREPLGQSEPLASCDDEIVLCAVDVDCMVLLSLVVILVRGSHLLVLCCMEVQILGQGTEVDGPGESAITA